jgi:hypothetical protein
MSLFCRNASQALCKSSWVQHAQFVFRYELTVKDMMGIDHGII